MWRFTIPFILLLHLVSAPRALGSTTRGDEVLRLSDAASFQEGCFDGCACPITQPLPIRGTLLLGPPIQGKMVDYREVEEVNWIVSLDGTTLHRITGSGTHLMTNTGPPVTQALELDLSIDGAEPQRFFSDFVPVTPGAIDVPITMHGLVCYDILIQVVALPVPPDEIQRYALVSGSDHVSGCFPPCKCPLRERPLVGSFDLVRTATFGTQEEFSVIAFRAWAVGGEHTSFRGSGNYTLIQGFAGPLDSLELTLEINGQAPIVFDSGLNNTSAVFPDIQAVVDEIKQSVGLLRRHL